MTRIEEIKAAQRAPVPHDLPQAFKQLAAKTVAIDDLLSLVEEARDTIRTAADAIEGDTRGMRHGDRQWVREARAWLSKVEEAT